MSVRVFVCKGALSEGHRGLLGPQRGGHRGQRSHHNGTHPPNLLILLSCQMAHTQPPVEETAHTYICIFEHKHCQPHTYETHTARKHSRNIFRGSAVRIQFQPANQLQLTCFVYLKQKLVHYRAQCHSPSKCSTECTVVVSSLISAGLALSLKHVTIWVQGHLGNASLCDVFVACCLSSISRANVSLFETIKRESAPSSGCVCMCVPSAEVQGRTHPDVQQ